MYVACDGVQGAPRVLAHGWVPYERFSCMYTAPQLPYSHLVNLVIDQMQNGPEYTFLGENEGIRGESGQTKGRVTIYQYVRTQPHQSGVT